MSRAQERTSYQPPPRRKQYRVLFLGNAATGKASMRNRVDNLQRDAAAPDVRRESRRRPSQIHDDRFRGMHRGYRGDGLGAGSPYAGTPHPRMRWRRADVFDLFPRVVWRAGVSVDDGETGEGQGEEEWGGEKNLEEMCGDNDRGNLSSEQYELSQ
ncbi:hypothetical protein EYC84_009330 [Monilinia fructicola]|uniref:Uncharacterized protein n=1 Tax=Monilinia fructicola TaxID=38448 RepID=A0A5M9JA73_MONFR|nr:hypothetical protein EYC84_009330 [Monilinia fructicola]